MQDDINFSSIERQPQQQLKNRRRPQKNKKAQHILPGNLINTTTNSKLAQLKQRNQP
jgi:hypothetical protein